jgi:hypothetical protein
MTTQLRGVRGGRRASTFVLATPFALVMSLASLGACGRGAGGSAGDGGLGAAPVGLAGLVIKEYEARQAAFARPGPGSNGLSPAILSLLAPTEGREGADLPPKGSSVGAQVAQAPAPKPRKPKAIRYPGYRRWSGRDCAGIVRHDASYCESRDCTATVRRDASYCETRDCTAYVRNDASYCESRDCTAIVRHDASYCETRDCTGYIRNDTSYCETRNCTGIVRHDASYCD